MWQIIDQGVCGVNKNWTWMSQYPHVHGLLWVYLQYVCVAEMPAQHTGADVLLFMMML